MPQLKQISCGIQWADSSVPFQEYGTIYGDGVVETFIVVPNKPQPFRVHIRSKGYIFEGLAAVLFMDGIYQVNRNRVNLVPPTEDQSLNRTEIDFLIRQKEKSLGDGMYMGREWRFDDYNQVTELPTGIRESHFDELGTIEVLILRCRSNLPEEAFASPSSSGADSDVFSERQDDTIRRSTEHPAANDIVGALDVDDPGEIGTAFGGLFDGTDERGYDFGLDGSLPPPGSRWPQYPIHDYQSHSGARRPMPESSFAYHQSNPSAHNIPYVVPPPQSLSPTAPKPKKHVHFDFGSEGPPLGLHGPRQDPIRVRPPSYNRYRPSNQPSNHPNIASEHYQPRQNTTSHQRSQSQPYGTFGQAGVPHADGNQNDPLPIWSSQAHLYPPPVNSYLTSRQFIPPQVPLSIPYGPVYSTYSHPYLQQYWPPYIGSHPQWSSMQNIAQYCPPGWSIRPPHNTTSASDIPDREPEPHNQRRSSNSTNNSNANWNNSTSNNQAQQNATTSDAWDSGNQEAQKNDAGGNGQSGSNNGNTTSWENNTSGNNDANANNDSGSYGNNGADSWNSQTGGNDGNNFNGNDSNTNSWNQDTANGDTGNWASNDANGHNGNWSDNKPDAGGGDNWVNTNNDSGNQNNSGPAHDDTPIPSDTRPLFGPYGQYFTWSPRGPNTPIPDAEEEPRYDVPKRIADAKGLSKQVQPGQGYLYYKKRCVPQYIDTLNEPYARFVFKYRTKEQIKNEIGIDIETEPTGDEAIQELQNMDKQALIEMLLRAKSALGGKVPSPPAKPSTPASDTPGVKAPIPVDPAVHDFLKYQLPQARAVHNSGVASNSDVQNDNQKKDWSVNGSNNNNGNEQANSWENNNDTNNWNNNGNQQDNGTGWDGNQDKGSHQSNKDSFQRAQPNPSPRSQSRNSKQGSANGSTTSSNHARSTTHQRPSVAQGTTQSSWSHGKPASSQSSPSSDRPFQPFNPVNNSAGGGHSPAQKRNASWDNNQSSAGAPKSGW